MDEMIKQTWEDMKRQAKHEIQLLLNEYPKHAAAMAPLKSTVDRFCSMPPQRPLSKPWCDKTH